MTIAPETLAALNSLKARAAAAWRADDVDALASALRDTRFLASVNSGNSRALALAVAGRIEALHAITVPV